MLGGISKCVQVAVRTPPVRQHLASKSKRLICGVPDRRKTASHSRLTDLEKVFPSVKQGIQLNCLALSQINETELQPVLSNIYRARRLVANAYQMQDNELLGGTCLPVSAFAAALDDKLTLHIKDSDQLFKTVNHGHNRMGDLIICGTFHQFVDETQIPNHLLPPVLVGDIDAIQRFGDFLAQNSNHARPSYIGFMPKNIQTILYNPGRDFANLYRTIGHVDYLEDQMASMVSATKNMSEKEIRSTVADLFPTLHVRTKSHISDGFHEQPFMSPLGTSTAAIEHMIDTIATHLYLFHHPLIL
jgi:hypothetical protein